MGTRLGDERIRRRCDTQPSQVPHGTVAVPCQRVAGAQQPLQRRQSQRKPLAPAPAQRDRQCRHKSLNLRRLGLWTTPLLLLLLLGIGQARTHRHHDKTQATPSPVAAHPAPASSATVTSAESPVPAMAPLQPLVLIRGLSGLLIPQNVLPELPEPEPSPIDTDAQAEPEPAPMVDANGHQTDFPILWRYEWGDSPVTASGQLLWTKSEIPPGTFQQTTAGDTPPGRKGRSFLWVRTRLDGPVLAEPTLYFLGVQQLVEVYLDGQRIFHFGEFTGEKALKWAGFRSLLVPLPQNYQGKVLALRVYSTHRTIGPYQQVWLGGRGALVQRAFVTELPKVGIGALLVLLGLISLALFAQSSGQAAYGYYAGFSMSTGMYVLTQVQVRNLVVDAPIGWYYVELFALYLIPTFLCPYFLTMFGRGPWRLTKRLAQVNALYVIGAAVLVSLSVVPILKTLLPMQALLLVNIVYMSSVGIVGALRGDYEARLFMLGFGTAATLAIYDVLVALGLMPRLYLTVSHLGNAVFVVALGLIMVRRIVGVQRRMTYYSSVLQLSLASTKAMQPGQHAQVALDQVVKLLGAKRALLYLSEPGTGELVLAAAHEVSTIARPDAADEDALMAQEVLRTKQPIVQLGQRGSFRGEKQRRRMAAPLLIQEQVLGVLYLELPTARHTSREEDEAVLLGLSNQLALTIATTRALRLEVESALTAQRLAEQEALLRAATQLATGDLETPIAMPPGSQLAEVARTLDDMRIEVQGQIHLLESQRTEVQQLNDELRRQIEQRSHRLMEILLKKAPSGKPASVLRPGQFLGDQYKVLHVLGQGAMGAVYEVERQSDHRHLAAKLLRERARESQSVRFVREAQILAKLQHPLLVGILDVDVTDDGALFLVMELVSGGTVRALRERYGDPAFAIPVLQQVAEALAVVHDQGIVHRDLKPANILLSSGEDGEPPHIKLADFGVSTLLQEPQEEMTVLYAAPEQQPEPSDLLVDERDIAEDQSEMPTVSVEGLAIERSTDGMAVARTILPTQPEPQQSPYAPLVSRTGSPRSAGTQAGALVGTPLYMAPELAGGSLRAQPSSDIWSFGVIAYELLRGQLPFAEAPVLAKRKGKPEQIKQLDEQHSQLARPLIDLLNRCLLTDPAARPSAHELSEGLREQLTMMG